MDEIAKARAEMASQEAALIEDFSYLTEWEDRYAYLIDLGKKLTFDPNERIEDNRVSGCQSKVWLHTALEDGRLHIAADSDSVLVKGLLAITLSIYHHQPIDAILAHPFECFKAMGLSAHLTPARNNGVMSVYQTILQRAKALSGPHS